MAAAEPEPHARLFIAVLVPEAVKDRVAAAQEELKKTLPDGLVRWTVRHQFHLTLRFLGNVILTAVPALTEAIQVSCRSCEPMRLTAEGIGFFPNARRPRVAWVGVKDAEDALSRLQEALQTATLSFTSEPAEEKFTGHITLGRFKSFDRSKTGGLANQAEALARIEFGKWDCTEIHLMQSQLSPHGATHVSLTAARLGKA